MCNSYFGVYIINKVLCCLQTEQLTVTETESPVKRPPSGKNEPKL